jgi:hypothetical protein
MRSFLPLAMLALAVSVWTSGCKTDTSIREAFEKEQEAERLKEKERAARSQAAEEAEDTARPQIDVDAVRQDPDRIRELITWMYSPSLDGKRTEMDALNWTVLVGEAAVPLLEELLVAKFGDPQVRYVADFAMTHGVAEWRWRNAMPASMALSQIRSPKSAAALLKNMTKPIEAPEGLTPEQAEDWNARQANRIRFNAWGLMSIMQPSLQNDALAMLRDRNIDMDARLQVGVALAYHFTPESSATLLSIVDEPMSEMDEAGDAGADDAEDKDMPLPLVDAGNVTRFLPLLALGVDWSSLPRFNRIFFDDFGDLFGESDYSGDIAERRDEVDVKISIDVVAACRANFDCYLGILEGGEGQDEGSAIKYDPAANQTGDPDEEAYLKALGQTKAALVLGRWNATDEQCVQLLKLFDSLFTRYPYDATFEDLRLALMLGIERQGLKNRTEAVALLKDRMRMEAMKGEPAAEFWNQRLLSLKVFLERQ